MDDRTSEAKELFMNCIADKCGMQQGCCYLCDYYQTCQYSCLKEDCRHKWMEKGEKARVKRKEKRLIISTLNYILLFLMFVFVVIQINDVMTLIYETKDEVKSFRYEVESQQSEQISRGTDRPKSVGSYTITYYDAKCAKCCGDTNGITASGKIAEPNRTVAVPQDGKIKLGSTLVINGTEYIAEDYMSAKYNGEQRVDICVETHEYALEMGVKEAMVYIYE